MKGKGFTNDAIPALSLVESPIEGRFVQAFFDVMRKNGLSGVYLNDESCSFSVEFSNQKEFPEFIYKISGQVRFKELECGRVDFVIKIDNYGNTGYCVVEADGYEFHSSPKDQERDRKRDRFFASNGILCLRYTGKELYNDAESCVTEAISILCNKIRTIDKIRQEEFYFGVDCGVQKSLRMAGFDLAKVSSTVDYLVPKDEQEQVSDA